MVSRLQTLWQPRRLHLLGTPEPAELADYQVTGNKRAYLSFSARADRPTTS
jgi:hypothetical protein